MTNGDAASINGHLNRLWRRFVFLIAVGIVINAGVILGATWQASRWVANVESDLVQDRERILANEKALTNRQQYIDRFVRLEGAVETDRRYIASSLDRIESELRALRRERDGG